MLDSTVFNCRWLSAHDSGELRLAPFTLVVSGAPVESEPDLIAGLAKRADYVCAVDSGADALAQVGFTPDLLLGDFDSIDKTTLESFRAKGVQTQAYDAYKDATDTDLALNTLKEQGHAAIIGTRILGGRLDHELASLGSFAKAAEQDRAVAIVEQGETCLFLSSRSRYRRLMIDFSPEHTIGPTPSLISLIPWGGDAVVSINGVEWELDHSRLERFGTQGVSNIPKEEQVLVEAHTGLVIVILQ